MWSSLAYATRYGYKIVEAPIILKLQQKRVGQDKFQDRDQHFLDTVAVASRFGIFAILYKALQGYNYHAHGICGIDCISTNSSSIPIYSLA